VDLLLVAGDIFHTNNPSSQSQQLYYDFLHRMAASPCRHVVLIAGNHDSSAFLAAPKALLRPLDIHVLAASRKEAPEEEVLLLKNQEGEAEAIICAVPYLRDRDLRTAVPGQEMAEREQALVEGIQRHYEQVCAAALALNRSLPWPVPLIGMGHLFTAGGKTEEGDGTRSLYVGSLAYVQAKVFPASLDYLALGHLHSPQEVGKMAHRRYSGAPLTMSFSEAGKSKSLCLIDFLPSGPEVQTLAVPVFQRLERIQGDWPQLAEALARLRAENQSIWLEISYQGEAILADLRQRIEAAIQGSQLEVLRIRNLRCTPQSLCLLDATESLATLGHEEIFRRCLAAHEVPAAQQPALQAAYDELFLALEQGPSED
jgi:exonuclease SbcD